MLLRDLLMRFLLSNLKMADRAPQFQRARRYVQFLTLVAVLTCNVLTRQLCSPARGYLSSRELGRNVDSMVKDRTM